MKSHRHRVGYQNAFNAFEVAENGDDFAKRDGGHDRKVTQKGREGARAVNNEFKEG